MEELLYFLRGKSTGVYGVDDVAGGEGVEGGCFCAQSVVAEGDGAESGLECQSDFVGSEVAFGSDEDEGVASGLAGGCEVDARDCRVTVGYDALCVGHHFDDFSEGCHGHDGGEGGFERLFHCCNGNFFESLDLDLAAFAAVAEEGYDGVDSDFGHFFNEPFHAVEVFGGGYGYCESVAPREWHGGRRDDFDCGVLGVCVDEATGVCRPFPVDDLHFVAFGHAQDSDGVARVAFGELGVGEDVGGKELYHDEIFLSLVDGLSD